jgi:hypothetical protein
LSPPCSTFCTLLLSPASSQVQLQTSIRIGRVESWVLKIMPSLRALGGAIFWWGLCYVAPP